MKLWGILFVSVESDINNKVLLFKCWHLWELQHYFIRRPEPLTLEFASKNVQIFFIKMEVLICSIPFKTLAEIGKFQNQNTWGLMVYITWSSTLVHSASYWAILLLDFLKARLGTLDEHGKKHRLWTSFDTLLIHICREGMSFSTVP